LNRIQIETAIGGLLHDIGKVLYRYNDGRNHSESGYDYLKKHEISNIEILDQIRYHHSNLLKGAKIPENSPAYITYWADNVAAGADRRSADGEAGGNKYNRYVPLQSVFNILNGNKQRFSYPMEGLNDEGRIIYPVKDTVEYSEETYSRIINNISAGINQIELNEKYINSLLGVLEANLSGVPSSTDTTQLTDISLFDHMKITAAIGGCILEYLTENGVENYKEALYKRGSEYYGKDSFLMLSMDMSGIQNFIFQVVSDGALKSLRSKSFYLEMSLEHIIDELLGRLELSRANLIYSGGGHAYLLLANTEKTKSIINRFDDELKQWFISNFGIELYVAIGYVECSANDLMNKEDGSFEAIFKNVSLKVSERKVKRYNGRDILKMNLSNNKPDSRECRVCGKTDNLDEEELCEFCSAFKSISSGILRESFITVLSEKPEKEVSIKLPFDRYMVLDNEDRLKVRMNKDKNYIRSYSKNRMYTGLNLSTRLWVGDYINGETFNDFAESSQGIERIGVLRADVDNLGKAFVSGFESCYAGLSRSASFSRRMNMFFKFNINNILANPVFGMDGIENEKRKAVIVYSGGDDVFIIGAWNDIIGASVDISDAFEKYSQGTLSISAGIGIYAKKYPVKSLAGETGELESCSKSEEGKNSVTLFDANGRENTYKWDVFKNKVIGEKLSLIDRYISMNPEKGMSFIYKIMEYVRECEEKSNLPRLAYLLGRISPEAKASDEQKRTFREFAEKIYEWTSEENKAEDRKQLLTAIYIYVYLNRGNKERNDG